MASTTGRCKILEQFLADGMDHMFGNPGTVEQGFLDALEQYPEMKYILTLQESVAVLVADGYARAARKPALVQLHSSPGIGNAVGALYQAKRGHAPLVVIGGDAGLKYINMDAQMANDLVAMMEPVTKYAAMVLHPASLLRTLRRAVKIAATPPMGPVYVCLPADVLDAPNDEPVFPTLVPSTRVSPEPKTVDDAAEFLLGAKSPSIFIGDGVAFSDAASELTKVAELLGARVWGVDTGEVSMDTSHPLYAGTTGHMFGRQSLAITKSGDVNLVVGTYMLPEVFPELGDIYADGAKVIHFDLNAYEIGKNHRVDIGVASDPKMSLSALGAALEKKMSAGQKKRAEGRIAVFAEKRREELENTIKGHGQREGKTSLHMSQFAKELSKKLPKDAVIFDEALTSSPDLTTYVRPKTPGTYFTTRGGSLGVGIPGAIGAKIADPGKVVVGFTGDGGSMYTIQALWTAARHCTGAKFVVCNNGSYRLLQLNIQNYWKENGMEPHGYPVCFDLSKPAIDFAALAESMGVGGVRVQKPEEIKPAIDRMLRDDEPFLIDLVLEGEVRPELIGVKCGQ